MLGSSVEETISDPRGIYRNAATFNWNSKSTLYRQIELNVNQFSQYVGNESWTIYWCAGAGTVSSSEVLLEQELDAVEELFRCIRNYFGPRTANGQFFFASSIGGMYSGTSQQPISELTYPVPAGIYGKQKQKVENLFIEFASENKCKLLIGRIANLYGLNQNLSKNQGLISSICKAKVLQLPVNIYSELDTVRNYIYVHDAAKQIVQLNSCLSLELESKSVIQLIASRQNHSISAVLKEIENVFGEPINYSLRSNPNPNIYPRNLSVRIKNGGIWTESGAVPLSVGIGYVRRELMRVHQMGQLRDRKNAEVNPK